MNYATLLIQLMLAVLFCHELDAMSQSEWRLLYVLRSMNDDEGRWWFVVIHLPLLWILIALTHSQNIALQNRSRIGLAGFCIVHALLHFRLRDDPLSSFNSVLSWALIIGAALLGVAYLLMLWNLRKPSTERQTLLNQT